MTTWCCVTPERLQKVRPMMAAAASGWPEGQVWIGKAPDNHSPFVVWGQIWLAEIMIRESLPTNRAFWQMDNGFFKSAKGSLVGYYRFMYRRPDPILADPELARRRLAEAPELKVEFKPWRKSGKHILVAIPGQNFGRAYGINVVAWSREIEWRLRQITDRPLVVRYKDTTRPLAEDLKGAWAMVTHSSNIAVDAVVAGCPVFVEPTSMAAPVGRLDLSELENPLKPDRQDWWGSLMCQQFTVDEMASGLAYRYLAEAHKL